MGTVGEHYPGPFSVMLALGGLPPCAPHLASINATLGITSTEHLGFDLVPVEVRAVADLVAYDGDPGLLEHHSLLA